MFKNALFRSTLVILFISLYLATGAFAIEKDDDQREQMEQTALEIIATRYNLEPVNLSIAASATADFPLQELSAYHFKILDAAGGKTYGIALDREGNEVDVEELIELEGGIHNELYGKIEPALLAQMSEPEELIDVVVWVKETEEQTIIERPDTDTELSESDIEALYQQVDERAANIAEMVTQPIRDRIINMGYEVTNDPDEQLSAPVVYAALRPDAIREIAGWEEVDTVYISSEYESTLNTARQVIGAHVVHNQNITGAGTKVAVIEVGGQAYANPYLPNIFNDPTNSCLSTHSTFVAGVIGSNHPTYRGIAPDAAIWVGGSCYGSGSQLIQAANRARFWANTSTFNLSWGSTFPTGHLNYVDREFDRLVRDGWRTVVASAGNSGYTWEYVGTPAAAYNLIGVGAFDDKNTTAWSNDTMASFSSWRDPISTHNDREKPEVAAPGVNILSTIGSSPWISSASGTSCSAPMVTGTSALMMQRRSALKVWPEAVKAILMATAWENIEGSARLSERDGAGGVVADRADDVSQHIEGKWGGRYYSCSTNSLITLGSMPLRAGRRTRAVIAWDTDPDYSSYTTRPSADLDMWIRQGSSSGPIVAASFSWDNTYEIVDFTPDRTDNYYIQVNKYRCSSSPDWLGWAWSH